MSIVYHMMKEMSRFLPIIFQDKRDYKFQCEKIIKIIGGIKK